MADFLNSAQATLAGLIPVAAFFMALAAITKRARLPEALRASRKEAATNAGLYLVNYIVLAPAFLVLALVEADKLPRLDAFSSGWTSVPEAVAVFVAMLVIDLTSYWRHRFGHIRAVWRYHATHHADETLNWFSVTRKHPVDKLMEIGLDSLPALMLGAPLWAIGIAQFARSWWGHFVHADVPWTLGPLKRVLISPAAHRLHHARDEALMGANFANTFAFIDVMFGTFSDPTPHVNCATGIAEGSRGVAGELARPFEQRYRTAPPASREVAA